MLWSIVIIAHLNSYTMKKILIPYLFLVLVSCGSNSNSPVPDQPTYQQTKMTLEETEMANPLNFLKVSGTYRQNLIDQWVVEGYVANSASVAIYKDVLLNIVYFSKTGTELGSVQKTLYEFLRPNGSQSFKFVTNGFEGTSSVNIGIVSAVAARQ